MERSTASGASDGALRLAISAALQRLGGMGFDQQGAAKPTAKLLQGLDAEGVHEYCAQMMANFLAAGRPGAVCAAWPGHPISCLAFYLVPHS